jgi:hypothetical protein
MAASRRQAAVVVLGTISLALVACDTLLGLGQYDEVACAAGHCDSGTPEGGVEGGTVPMPDASDAAMGIESGSDADAADVVTVPDGGYPPPTAHEVWAHWPMPNPDASIGPESSTPLPNPMTYTLAADGGGVTAYDVVTKLSWWRQALSAMTYDAAGSRCANVSPGGGWRVPTRIELVSLIDFTRTPTIETTTFLDAGGAHTWTSSAVPGDGGPPEYWDVDFSTGLTGYGNTPTQVICVSGGMQ